MSKLELDALTVESFGTTAARIGEPGTVRARAGGVAGEEEEVAITTPPATHDASCLGTCQSCWGTCGASCPGTCAWSCVAGCSDSCATGGPICCG